MVDLRAGTVHGIRKNTSMDYAIGEKNESDDEPSVRSKDRNDSNPGHTRFHSAMKTYMTAFKEQ